MKSARSARNMLLALVACLPLASNAFAQLTAPPTVVPAPSLMPVMRSAGNGFTLAVDCNWPRGVGYRPVSVTIAPISPSSADRELTVELSMHCWTNYLTRTSVTQHIAIPSGSSGETVKILLPQYHQWNYFDLVVRDEDGRELEKLTQKGKSLTYGANDFNDLVPAMIFVTDGTNVTQPINGLSDLVDTQQYGGGPLVQQILRLDHDALPDDWLAYTALDTLILSQDDIEYLAGNRPEALKAIDSWVRQGGNLWVHGVGIKWGRLSALEKRLGFWPAAEGADWVSRGWHLPAQSGGALTLNSSFVQAPYQGVRAQSMAMAPRWTGADQAPFMWRQAGLGSVAVLPASDRFGGHAEEWVMLMNSLGPERLLAYKRRGLSTTSDNSEFWTFLIPGVGEVPVTMFRVAITLFVLFIGPVTYIGLRRRHKLHLLLFIVPATAIVITLSMFAYAAIADGFGVRIRARSYTNIDQRAGKAVCNTRLSYYAGFAPSGGLKMPADVAVFPLLTAIDRNAILMPEHSIRWRDDAHGVRDQLLERGWLNSRTPTQFVTERVRPSKLHVTFVPAKDKKPAELENHLGANIEQVLVWTDPKTFFWAENLKEGGRASLLKADAAMIAGFARTLQQRAPVAPPEFTAATSSSLLGMGSSAVAYNRNSVTVSVNSSRAEQQVQVFLFAASPPKVTTPRGYFAIVDRSPEVAYGVGKFSEEGSLHMIEGSW